MKSNEALNLYIILDRAYEWSPDYKRPDAFNVGNWTLSEVGSKLYRQLGNRDPRRLSLKWPVTIDWFDMDRIIP